jgi:hypothetical protein
MAKGRMTGRRRTFRLNNMTGLLNTMSEENNYLTFDPNANLGAALTQIPFEFKMVENWMPTNRGGLSKTFGYSQFFNTGTASKVTGLYRFRRSDGSNFFMYGQGTKAYKLVAGVPTDIGATFGNGAWLHFETAMDKLIICDGVNAPVTWDASSTGSLTNGPSVLRATVFYQNRLFGFGNTGVNGSYVYYSDSGTLDNMANNFVSCSPNDGQKITSLALFFIPGQIAPVLIVGKEKSIGIIVGDGSGGNPYTFVKIGLDVGIPGFRQITQFQQDAAFLTPLGMSSYQTAIKNVNIQQQLLSGKITNQFTSLSPTYLPDAISWFDWKNRRVSCAVASGASNVSDTLWHYDIELKGWYKQSGFNVTASFVDEDGYVYTGDNIGRINKHDPATSAYSTSAINATLQTPYLDFFEPMYYKRIVEAKIVVRGNGSYNLGLSCSLNFGASYGSSHSIPISSGLYTWGGGVWTEDPGVYQWGGSPLTRRKFFPSGMFENISFIISQPGAFQPVDLLEIVLEVEYLNLI